MSIMVTCANCGKTLQAKDEWAGKNVRCPGCKEVITVPSMKSGGPPPAPAASKSRSRDEDYDEEPVARRRGRDDDDDDKPVRRRRSGGGDGGDLRDLKEFSPALVVVLHFVTCGIFTWIWLGMLHGKLPKVRDDDPSAASAILLMLVPFYNFYWVFFSYRRLVLRLNEAREENGLEPNVPDGLALAMCIIMIIPYVGLISAAILMPIFAAIVQSRTNELAHAVNG